MPGTAFPIDIDGTPTNGDNPWIDSLVWGSAWDDETDDGVVTISYAYGSGETTAILGNGVEWSETEEAALANAMDAWENVANIEFVETTTNDADIVYYLGVNWQVSGALGWHDVPGTTNDDPIAALFNVDGAGWTDTGLQTGGYGYVTLVHELGHGLGLAHPHDGGSEPDGNNFPGVTSPFDDYGLYDLNQGIFTVMSYNDGWPTQNPDFFDEDYGWNGGPMALDIAAIQEIYGANMDYMTGDDVYMLPDTNEAGTYWYCIWDAGGVDTISNEGSDLGAMINLNEAPLTGEHAGGYVSFIDGIMGGFTIANGVTIENAIGGNGDDEIVGNDANNTLDGGLGSDTLMGGAGDDIIFGGGGGDRMNGGAGDDMIYGSDDEMDIILAFGGSDVIEGGDGRDIIISFGSHTVTDYVEGEDIWIQFGRGTMAGALDDGADHFLF